MRVSAIYRPVHCLPGRMRLRPLEGCREPRALGVGRYLSELPGVLQVAVSGRTASILVFYDPQDCEALLLALEHGVAVAPPGPGGVPEYLPPPTGAQAGDEPEAGLGLPRLLAGRFLLPKALRPVTAVIRALPFLVKGARALLAGRASVEVLDGVAILISLLRRDFGSATFIAFLLGLGEVLEGMLRKRARAGLAATLAHRVEKAWLVQDGREILVPGDQLRAGDRMVVRAGGMCPVDGAVEHGLALVDESSFTGEPLPARKQAGAKVFAGSVVSEGEILVLAEHVGLDAKIARLLRTVEESEKVKAEAQIKALRIADAVVPLTFGLSGLTYAVTRNPTKALSVLLADYSCAVKLAVPLCILGAMRDAAGFGAAVKGGKFLEALHKADVIVFDKTGTLTRAEPRVAEVYACPGQDPDFVLRTAACLEEHFPHPVARAVVRAAREAGLDHEEEHAKVEYILAHGIASRLGGRKVVIGSRHFVHEDEGVPLPRSQRRIRELSAQGHTLLHLAIGGKLAGVLAVEDTLRPDAAESVAALKAQGFRRVVLLSGDSQAATDRVAASLGIAEARGACLPEDKARFVRELKEAGHVVVMVGDGVNDTSALAQADVGVSLGHGADIAKESCDILITGDGLMDLVRLRQLAGQALNRVSATYRGIIGVNTLLIALGVAGIMPPRFSAVLHNCYTLAAAGLAFRPYRTGGN